MPGGTGLDIIRGDLPTAWRTESLRPGPTRDGEVVVGLPPRRDPQVDSSPNCRCHGDVPLSALVPAVIMSAVVDSGRKSGHGNIDANDPYRKSSLASIRHCR